MYCTRKLTEQVWWVGGSDRRLALFENLFPITRGVSYNSYLILDEQTAVVDTVDSSISRQFLENVLHTLDGRPLDYLVINHMEPDHCASIETLLLRFPTLKLVGNAKTFAFMGQFYDFPLDGRTVTVKEGDTLSLGGHTLQFHMTPMVHWPEVMMTYESSEKLLFSADAFGSFGATGGNLFNDELNFDRDWLDDARRYYGNIVGKYGLQVQAALKKLSGTGHCHDLPPPRPHLAQQSGLPSGQVRQVEPLRAGGAGRCGAVRLHVRRHRERCQPSGCGSG